MQQPTFTGIHIRTVADAHVIFHAVTFGLLHMVSRRLGPEERQFIQSGSVFIWEERPPLAEANGAGITRWTDGRRWGPSRVRDEFLFYQEKLPEFEADAETTSLILGSRLVKQTYSAFVNTPHGRRKWHLVAYFTRETLGALLTIDHIPGLAALRDDIREGQYLTARTSKARTRNEHAGEEQDSGSAEFSQRPRYSPSPSPPAPRGDGTPHTPGCPETAVPDFTSAPFAGPVGGTDAAESAARLPDPHQAQSLALRERTASQDLAPLVYLRMHPYPPRHPIDSVALRSLDCSMRIF
ncbi:hypothetical protein AcW1_008712 [Taiwanofungus camphoratus]|nr:hypothetical protein AcW1_008712 [Antrodia cinnamomea]